MNKTLEQNFEELISDMTTLLYLSKTLNNSLQGNNSENSGIIDYIALSNAVYEIIDTQLYKILQLKKNWQKTKF